MLARPPRANYAWARLARKLAAKIRDLRFSASQNDRAAPARKQARLACGGDGSGGAGDVEDGATCAHHAVANIGELGRKAIDAPLKALMKITDEQSSADSAKVKCLRTSVGLGCIHVSSRTPSRFLSVFLHSTLSFPL